MADDPVLGFEVCPRFVMRLVTVKFDCWAGVGVHLNECVFVGV